MFYFLSLQFRFFSLFLLGEILFLCQYIFDQQTFVFMNALKLWVCVCLSLLYTICMCVCGVGFYVCYIGWGLVKLHSFIPPEKLGIQARGWLQPPKPHPCAHMWVGAKTFAQLEHIRTQRLAHIELYSHTGTCMLPNTNARSLSSHTHTLLHTHAQGRGLCIIAGTLPAYMSLIRLRSRERVRIKPSLIRTRVYCFHTIEAQWDRFRALCTSSGIFCPHKHIPYTGIWLGFS